MNWSSGELVSVSLPTPGSRLLATCQRASQSIVLGVGNDRDFFKADVRFVFNMPDGGFDCCTEQR